MRRKRKYQGQVGVFRAPSSKTGWRRINRRGVVSNVTLPSGMTEPTNVIKNPFRSGLWSWKQASGRPRPAGGAPVAPTNPAPDTGFVPDFGGFPQGFDPATLFAPQPGAFVGPWVQGFDAGANPQWKPMVGGGFINVNTGQTWTDPAVAAAQASEYEKTLMDTLKGMFGGQV